MHLTYLDEVKYQKGKEPYYWLCGLAFPEEEIGSLDESMASISTDYFGSGLLSKETEFHARDIVHGKGPFKGHDLGKRCDLFIKLLDALDGCAGLGKIEVRIDVEKLFAGSHHERAFMFVVERVNSHMKAVGSLALLICDHDDDAVSGNVANLSSYKQFGTDYEFGSDIKNVVDTVHHTHSHHSRLLQLADIYAYTMALQSKEGLKFPRKEILDHARENTRLTAPSKYKYWPTANSRGVGG